MIHNNGLSLENNEEDHDHTYGYINCCNLCWWKEIETTNGQLIYFSTKKCSYIRKSREQKEISICITMSTIEWICTYCSLLTKNKVKHLYIFPKNMKKILRYFTPAQEKLKT